MCVIKICAEKCLCFLKTDSCWEKFSCLKILNIELWLLIKIIIMLILLSLIIYFTVFLVKKLFGKPWCHINTDVSVSTDNGKTYIKEYNSIQGIDFILKYEITAKAYGFLSELRKRKIQFMINVQKHLGNEIYLHEYSGTSIIEQKQKETQPIIYNEKFELWTKGKKTETAIIILKCKHENNVSSHIIDLSFDDKYLKQYSRTTTLEF